MLTRGNKKPAGQFSNNDSYQQINNNDEGNHSLSLGDISGTFLVLIVGSSLAIMTLVFEKVCHHFQLLKLIKKCCCYNHVGIMASTSPLPAIQIIGTDGNVTELIITTRHSFGTENYNNINTWRRYNKRRNNLGYFLNTNTTRRIQVV